MFQISLKYGCNNLYSQPCTLMREIKIIFLSDVTFSLCLRKSVNPNFPQYQSDRNNNKFNCCLEIQLKTAAEISIWTLNFFKLLSDQINIWCQFTVVARYIRQPPFSKYQNSDLQKQFEIHLLFWKITEK